MAQDTYLVFARKVYEEPLEELGTISAADAEAARQEAQKTYPDDDWLEMIAIPQHLIVPVITGSHMAKEKSYD